ncbi:hypothetical protein XaFJ1_GM001788 [Xanthomonas albilineans]|nr:hypothetical protein XaFJ1_GM001788 [Xanthomonas albilineans]
MVTDGLFTTLLLACMQIEREAANTKQDIGR